MRTMHFPDVLSRPARARFALLLTIALAACAGSALGLALAPWWQRTRALSGIASHEAAVRADAWSWLTARGTDDLRLRSSLLRVNLALAQADDAPLLDAGLALRRVQLWDWSNQPADLLLRELHLRGQLDDPEQDRIVLQHMADVPLDAPAEIVLSVFQALIDRGDSATRRAVFEAAWMWSGPNHAHRTAVLFADSDIAALRDLNQLALNGAVRLAEDAPPGGATVRTTSPLDVRLAAWRESDIEPAVLKELLHIDVLTQPVHVFAQALLAERHMPPEQAALLAEQWIRSLDDAEKQAGALLAALLGSVHHDLLRKAFRGEDQPEVRAAQLLALRSLDALLPHEAGMADQPVELAWRMLHEPNGDLDPDIALLMLCAGDKRILEFLTSQPHVITASAITRRLMLIDRFVPSWSALVSEPADLDPSALRAHLDQLHAARLITQRRLMFDPHARSFVLPVSP